MFKTDKNTILNTIKLIFCTLTLTFSIVPSFCYIGNLFHQIVLTVVCSLCAMLVYDLIFKCKPIIFSYSLVFMSSFWIVLALIKQLMAHIEANDFTFNWIYLFYYDKPAMIFVTYFVCVLYFIIKLILRKNDEQYIVQYSRFIKLYSKAFLGYYAIILFYSFFLVRKITWVSPIVNNKPFEMIKFTFTRGYIDYELIFLFLGNIMIFFPLGIFVSAFTKRKSILIILPAVLSFVIEVSQYILGNGHPDVDDFLLNVLGFYLGVIFKNLIDLTVRKVTRGEIESFFLFEK